MTHREEEKGGKDKRDKKTKVGKGKRGKKQE